jgi:hypothetical protein
VQQVEEENVDSADYEKDNPGGYYQVNKAHTAIL